MVSFIDLKDRGFSFVLSGGGALGIAQLGIISEMEKQNVVPKEIIGTSMGGIIGACLAIGLKENEITSLFGDFSNVFNWIKFSFTGNAIIKSDKIEVIFNDIFGDLKMNQTDIPLKLITTNVITGKKRVFSSLDANIYIRDALLATMAIPGIFEEKNIEGEVYGDGFISENLGVNQASCNKVLAVDVLGEFSFIKELPDNIFKTSNVLNMFERSIRLLIYNQTLANISRSKKDIILIDLDTSDFKTFQFHKYKELREIGCKYIEKNLEE